MTSEAVLLIKTNYYYDTIEWIEYYKKLGFDHITIYDNESNIDFNEICKKYGDYITYELIVGFPDQLNLELKHYNNSKYDYVFFVDNDEFLWLSPKYKNINDYIEQKTTQFNCNHIAIYWIKISANPMMENRLDLPDTTQIKTFKYVQETEIDSWCKCIYKTKLPIESMECHFCKPFNDIRDTNGNIFTKQRIFYRKYYYKNDDALIYHYYHKSYKEYNDKINGNCATENILLSSRLTNYNYKNYYTYLKILYNIGYCKYDNTIETFLYGKY